MKVQAACRIGESGTKIKGYTERMGKKHDKAQAAQCILCQEGLSCAVSEQIKTKYCQRLRVRKIVPGPHIRGFTSV